MRQGRKPSGSARHPPPVRRCQVTAAMTWRTDLAFGQVGGSARSRKRATPFQARLHHHVLQARLMARPMPVRPHLLSPPTARRNTCCYTNRWCRPAGILKQALRAGPAGVRPRIHARTRSPGIAECCFGSTRRRVGDPNAPPAARPEGASVRVQTNHRRAPLELLPIAASRLGFRDAT